jgi:hypothetical protein
MYYFTPPPLLPKIKKTKTKIKKQNHKKKDKKNKEIK